MSCLKHVSDILQSRKKRAGNELKRELGTLQSEDQVSLKASHCFSYPLLRYSSPHSPPQPTASHTTRSHRGSSGSVCD